MFFFVVIFVFCVFVFLCIVVSSGMSSEGINEEESYEEVEKKKEEKGGKEIEIDIEKNNGEGLLFTYQELCQRFHLSEEEKENDWGFESVEGRKVVSEGALYSEKKNTLLFYKYHVLLKRRGLHREFCYRCIVPGPCLKVYDGYSPQTRLLWCPIIFLGFLLAPIVSFFCCFFGLFCAGCDCTIHHLEGQTLYLKEGKIEGRRKVQRDTKGQPTHFRLIFIHWLEQEPGNGEAEVFACVDDMFFDCLGDYQAKPWHSPEYYMRLIPYSYEFLEKPLPASRE